MRPGENEEDERRRRWKRWIGSGEVADAGRWICGVGEGQWRGRTGLDGAKEPRGWEGKSSVVGSAPTASTLMRFGARLRLSAHIFPCGYVLSDAAANVVPTLGGHGVAARVVMFNDRNAKWTSEEEPLCVSCGTHSTCEGHKSESARCSRCKVQQAVATSRWSSDAGRSALSTFTTDTHPPHSHNPAAACEVLEVI